MKLIWIVIVIIGFAFSTNSYASPGYKIVGKSGILHFVAIEKAQKDNENVYRYAVGEACAGLRICQVAFWVDKAPKSLPLTDEQVNAEIVRWQLNLNTGLRRWMVNCKVSKLFQDSRECM